MLKCTNVGTLSSVQHFEMWNWGRYHGRGMSDEYRSLVGDMNTLNMLNILKCSSVKHFQVLNRFKMKIIIFSLDHIFLHFWVTILIVKLSTLTSCKQELGERTLTVPLFNRGESPWCMTLDESWWRSLYETIVRRKRPCYECL